MPLLNGNAFSLDWTWNTDTHVLLTACDVNECALEDEFAPDESHGYFSRALLALFRTAYHDSNTYVGLLNLARQYMPVVKTSDFGSRQYVQNPAVRGSRKLSRLWFVGE